MRPSLGGRFRRRTAAEVARARTARCARSRSRAARPSAAARRRSRGGCSSRMSAPWVTTMTDAAAGAVARRASRTTWRRARRARARRCGQGSAPGTSALCQSPQRRMNSSTPRRPRPRRRRVRAASGYARGAGRPSSAAMISAVSRARDRSLETTIGATEDASQSRRGGAAAASRACARPVSLRGMSVEPWMRRSRFQSVSPWRTRVSRVTVEPNRGVARAGVGVLSARGARRRAPAARRSCPHRP